MPANNIWDLAVKQMRESEKNEVEKTRDSNIVFLGNKQTGKTSTIYRFVDRQENPKPTLALEYLFARRSRGLDTTKDVCHIWELGGGMLFTNLLEIPITLENLPTLSIALMLDLSIPEELWFTMENLLQAVRDRILDIFKRNSAKNKELKKTLMEQAWKRIGGEHEDKQMINPFPVPLIILGSKFDIFQNFDPEKKKVISRCLRYIAHINGAMLCFISKSESLVAKTRALISHLVFGTTASKTTITDYNKPIYVPFGEDSLKSIGNLPISDDDSGKQYSRSTDMWKHIFISHFPQVTMKLTIPDDPGSDPHFKERDIDMMRAQKDKELAEFKRETRRKKKNLESIDFD